MSPEGVRRKLTDDGYTEIDITFLGILAAKADACRRGTRYRVKLRPDGSYEYREKIGTCRPPVDAAGVISILEREGYRRVDVDDDKIPYIAEACRRGDRYRFEVSEFGDVTSRNRIGRCEPEMMSPRDIRRALRKDGFDRIKFIDRTPPRYVIEACEGNRRVRLTIDRRGRERNSERIGRCRPPVDTAGVEGLLRNAGYNRISIVDEKRPRRVGTGRRSGGLKRYRAEACKGTDRMRLVISPWGHFVNERKIGECPPPVTAEALRKALEEHPKGFKVLEMRRGSRYAHEAVVCHQGRKIRMLFSLYGKFEHEEADGRCLSPRVEEIMTRMRNGNLRDVKMYVEGCRRGRLYRHEIDEYGNLSERQRIGRCR